MEIEIEQQLIDFLLNNKKYDDVFINDLINILKCYLGVFAKEINTYNVFSIKVYYLLTTNFIIFVHKSKDNWFSHILYKLRKLSIITCLGSIFSLITDIKLDKIKKYYFEDRTDKIQKYLAIRVMNYQKHINDVEWLFATTPIKSANALIS